MSASRDGRPAVGLRMIAAAVLLGTVLPASGLDLAAPLTDPLGSLPNVIERGMALPGDRETLPCPVQKDFAAPLALADAVDLALCNNPQIKAAWAAIKVQASAVGEARAAYLPTLSGTLSRLRTHTAYLGADVPATTTYGNRITGTLAWRLFDFGGREAGREAANSLLAAAIASHDAILQKTLAAVVQAYFDAQSAQALLTAKDQNEAIAGTTLATAQRRESRGVASHSDTLQAATASAKASLDKNRAMGAYQKALAVLVYAMGVMPQTHLILADDLKDQAELSARSLESWLAIAENTHPGILAARAQWAAAKQKIVATRSDGLPSVDFSANYYQNGYPGQGLTTTESRVGTLGLTLNFPLFEGFSRIYKTRGAEAQAQQREAELQDTKHNLLMEVVKTYADATASLRNLKAAHRLAEAAQESLDSSRRRYDKGAADILEILNAQAALSDAQQERICSLAEWRSARLRLLASTGLMGRDSVLP